MTDTPKGQVPEALRLADKLNSLCVAEFAWPALNEAAIRLRRLHAENERLAAQVEALSAAQAQLAAMRAGGEPVLFVSALQFEALQDQDGAFGTYLPARKTLAGKFDKPLYTHAQPAEPYSMDADPQGIRSAVADAITGALAFGAQGVNPPPEGHWLAPFWNAARVDSAASAIDSIFQPAAQDAERYRLLNLGVDVIQADDEFLSDDTTTWATDPNGVFVGMPYQGYALLPARRKLVAAIAAQQGEKHE